MSWLIEAKFGFKLYLYSTNTSNNNYKQTRTHRNAINNEARQEASQYTTPEVWSSEKHETQELRQHDAINSMTDFQTKYFGGF